MPSRSVSRLTRPLAASLLVLVITACAITACAAESGTTVDPDPERPGLPAGVHELAGIEHTLPHTDLAPLRALVGDATVVALGESTHTSDGYYRAKFRMIRFLVEEMGFRVVAFETPWLDARAASEYVATCTGTPEAALAKFIVVWRATSVRDMLRWLCEYNQAHPADRVTFVGMDVQDPWSSAPAIIAFVGRAAPGETARAAPLANCLGAGVTDMAAFFQTQQFRDFVARTGGAVSAHAACLGALDDLNAYVGANAAALTAATSARQVEEARLALIALRAWELQLWTPFPGGYTVRDEAMAELTLRLRDLEAPGKKTIVWAWNWHIARRYQDVRGFNDDPSATIDRHGGRSMGSFLEERLGASYRPIAVIGYQVQMLGVAGPPIAQSPLAVERRLHELERDYLLVDLRQPVGGTLLPTGTTFQLSQEWGDPYRQFAGLVYLDHSPPMTLVP